MQGTKRDVSVQLLNGTQVRVAAGELLWPQCSLIVDVDDTREKEYGAYYTKRKSLRAAALKGG